MEAEPLIQRLNAELSCSLPFKVFEAHSPDGEEKILILISGMGTESAGQAIQFILHHYTPDQVMNCGIAGSLSKHLAIGTLVQVAEAGLVVDFNNGIDIRWTAVATSEQTNYPAVRLLSVSEPVFDPYRKSTLQPYAQLVDMEAAVIARHCSEQNTPCRILKIVSDDAENRQLLLDNLHRLSDQLAETLYMEMNPLTTQRCPA